MNGQVIVSFGGIVGLNFTPILKYLELIDYPRKKIKSLLEKLRAIEFIYFHEKEGNKGKKG